MTPRYDYGQEVNLRANLFGYRSFLLFHALSPVNMPGGFRGCRARRSGAAGQLFRTVKGELEVVGDVGLIHEIHEVTLFICTVECFHEINLALADELRKRGLE